MQDSITVVGNVASEPRTGATGGGIAYLNFRLASDSRRYDKASNTWIDGVPNWYTVQAYRGLAEHGARSLAKGDRVIVRGRIRVRDWSDGGRRGTTVEIEAEALGHDLRWGTSTFTRLAGVTQAAEPQSDGLTDADGWAVPGTNDVEQEIPTPF